MLGWGCEGHAIRGGLMKPEEVPIHFEPETIQFAITTWTMGATLFSEKQGQTLGQLFAILVGDRLQMEKEGKRIDPADLLIGFYRHLEGRIPEELRSEFSSLDPDRFDSTYKALREKAKQSDVGVDEICHALREIAAVTRYFADHLRNSDRGTNL